MPESEPSPVPPACTVLLIDNILEDTIQGHFPPSKTACEFVLKKANLLKLGLHLTALQRGHPGPPWGSWFYF